MRNIRRGPIDQATRKSKKGHISPPPRRLGPLPQTQYDEAREVGQFTGQGVPALEKK